MTRYWRISIPCRSASWRASADGRTLKPITIAFEAAARLTSFSVMPPTPVWMTLTRTSGCSILASSPTIASTEPCTSALRTMLRSATAPACSCSNRFSSETPRLARFASCLAAQPLAALVRELAGAAVVLDDARELAGLRRLVEAEDLDRDRPGLRCSSALAAVVVAARARGPRRRRRRSRRRP